MIILLLITLFTTFTGIIGQFLPIINELPFGLDTALSTAFGWINALIYYVWPLEVILEVTLFYFSFRIFLTILKIFLGNRTPKHD